jgi:hypothetical protein
MFSNIPSELDFKLRMESLGKIVVSSTKEQNISEHIDFFVDGVSFDVKGDKKLNRGDTTSSNKIVWLEMKNVRGDKGWLCSDVQKLAFKLGDFFYIFDRQTLLNFIRQFVGHGKVYKFKQYKQLYRRQNRKDLLTYVYLEDIIHLLEYKI